MKIELYSVKDEHGRLIEEFLIRNNIKFTKIITQDTELLSNIAQMMLKNPISILKMKKHNLKL